MAVPAVLCAALVALAATGPLTDAVRRVSTLPTGELVKIAARLRCDSITAAEPKAQRRSSVHDF
jgi:hypothetical protein